METNVIGISNSSQAVKSKALLIIILGILSAIIPFSIDMYLPGFPVIASDLNVTVDMVSYSLASFFIGICIGQLITGPLLDRYGRKTPLYIGIIIYILASIGCSLTNSVELLIVLRFLQALGGSVTMVAPRAIVRDIFPVNENAKIFSVLILVLSISPLLAPSFGSLIISTIGWKFVFVALAIITGLVLISLFLWLPESKGTDLSVTIKPRKILKGYISVLKHPVFFTYAISGSISFAALFAYLSGSPFVFMKIHNVSQTQYGIIFAIIAVGLTASSQLNSYLLRKHSPEKLMVFFIILQAIIGFILVVGTFTGILNLYSTIALIFLFLFCQGSCFPNSSALAMAPFAKDAGAASALLGALQMGLGALSAALVGIANPQSSLPMVTVMFGCTLLGLIVLGIGRISARKKPGQVSLSMAH